MSSSRDPRLHFGHVLLLDLPDVAHDLRLLEVELVDLPGVALDLRGEEAAAAEGLEAQAEAAEAGEELREGEGRRLGQRLGHGAGGGAGRRGPWLCGPGDGPDGVQGTELGAAGAQQGLDGLGQRLGGQQGDEAHAPVLPRGDLLDAQPVAAFRVPPAWDAAALRQQRVAALDQLRGQNEARLAPHLHLACVSRPGAAHGP